jgi:hypothetical protein
VRIFIIVELTQFSQLSEERDGMRWAGHTENMVKMSKAYKVFGGKPEGKRPLRRSSCRWEANSRKDFKERWCDFVDWIHMA